MFSPKEADVARQTRMLSIVLMLVLASTAAGQWFPIDKTSPTPPTVAVLSCDNSGTVLDVQIHGFLRQAKTVGCSLYDEITLPGEEYADLEVGKPQLPQVTSLLGVPDNALVTVSVQVLDSAVFGIGLCYPWQGNYPEDSEPPFAFDTSFYALDTVYPSMASLEPATGNWRDLTVSSVRTLPVRYDPATRQLCVYSHYRVTAACSGGSYSHRVTPLWMANMYSRLVANFDQLKLADWLDPQYYQSEELIITTNDHYQSLAPLVNWQEQRGIKTVLVHQANWSQDAVMNWVTAEYNNGQPHNNTYVLRWVLLVGKETQVPQYVKNALAPSDFLYATLGDLHELPVVGVGRLCPANEPDLNWQVQKILTYEQSPPIGDWCDRTLLVAHQGGGGNPGGFAYHQEEVRTATYEFHTPQFDCLYAYLGTTNQNLVDCINGNNAGGILTYRGHGDVGHETHSHWKNWDAGGHHWDLANIGQLTNVGRTPVVLNFCCLVHRLDDFANGSHVFRPSLGESWMSKQPGGAVASFGTSRGVDGNADQFYNRSFFDGLYDCNEGQPSPSAPVFDLGGLQDFIAARAFGQYWEDLRDFLWFGDPAMDVWCGGVPFPSTVSCPNPIPAGDYAISIAATSNSLGDSGALVCVRQNGQTLATGLTNGSGNISLDINTQPGSVLITVSGGHCHMLQNPVVFRQLTVSAQDFAIVNLDSSAISDPPPGGDGNGQLAPGEDFHMLTWVKNSGTQTAPGVQGVLTTLDDYVTQVGATPETYGDIQPGATAQGQLGSPEFQVHPDCPPGHQIHFTLLCTDTRGTQWYSYFTVPVDVGLPANVDPSATFPTQARHLVRRPNSEELHVVYQKKDQQDRDSIWHQRSPDGGTVWYRDVVALGQNPCISLDFNNLPWVTYTRNDSLFGNTCDLGGQWHEFLIFFVANESLGPASFVCSNLRSTGSITQPPDMGYAVFAVRPRSTQFLIYGLRFAAFDPTHVNSTGQHNYCVQNVHGDGSMVDTMACIAKTPGDYLHIIWQIRKPTSNGRDSIMYTTPDGPTTPWAIRTASYPNFTGAPVRLARGSIDQNLTSPFVDAYGDTVFATWADSLPWPNDCRAEVWRTAKRVSWQWPPTPENWSLSQNQPSDYPTMSAGTLVWANDGCDYDHLDVRARWSLSDLPVTVYSGRDCPQAFLHADLQQHAGIAQSTLRTLFTQMTPSGGYAVRFAQYVNIPMVTDGLFYSADIGDSAPSLYCLHRDGARQYGSCAVDYSDSALRYQLLYLNPMYHYRARLIMYHEDASSCQEVTTLNDSLPTTVAVPPLVHETLWLELPQSSYCNGRMNLSISKLAGADAVLAGLAVFQYESTSTGTGGGAQSAKTEHARLEPSLSSASLFSGHLTISYSLPSDARVSLRVFDLSGRTVRVLRDRRPGLVRAGSYSAEWDGCDDAGRTLSAGVYFSRLETESFHIGRKLVLTR